MILIYIALVSFVANSDSSLRDVQDERMNDERMRGERMRGLSTPSPPAGYSPLSQGEKVGDGISQL